MCRKVWLFLGILLLLIGLETVMTQTVVLNSKCTEILSKNNAEVQRKRWWVEALTGIPLEFPEKEIKINQMHGVYVLAISGVCLMHGIFFLKEKK